MALELANMLVLDYGMYPVSKKTAMRYDAIPKRKDGDPDQRYAVGKDWWRYMAEQTAACGTFSDPDQFVPGEWV